MTEAHLLGRARVEGTPLLDGDRATFVWRGPTAPRLVGDFTNWDAEPLVLRRAGDRLWTKRIDFYRDAYVEYGYLGPNGRVRDRFSRHARVTGLGATNHYFYMPGAAPTASARRRPGVARGTLERHRLDSHLIASARRVDLYTPAARGRFPLLVVLDGQEYLRRARLATIVDNLVAERRIRPIAMAFLHHAGRARVSEYACNEATLEFLLERLVPFARERQPLTSEAGADGILGASMGGLMALFAGLRAPAVFGHVLSQSGTFRLERDFSVFDLARRARRRPKVWLDIGHLEELVPANRRMRTLLASRGLLAGYREYHAGHHWPAWRDELPRGLELAFGR